MKNPAQEGIDALRRDAHFLRDHMDKIRIQTEANSRALAALDAINHLTDAMSAGVHAGIDLDFLRATRHVVVEKFKADAELARWTHDTILNRVPGTRSEMKIAFCRECGGWKEI